jgi:hypothetical protein
MRQHQRAGYSALFKASSDALKKLALDQKHIGGDLPGFFGVLHTWGRTLQYHPHIHYVVSGGAIGSADRSWHPSRIAFFLPVKALSVIFRAKFRDLMKQANLFDQIPPDLWQIAWNVNCQPVGASQATLKYLAPYVFKVAISNSRIVAVQDRTVRIRYRKPHSQRSRILALDVMEFIPACAEHGRQAPLPPACAAHRFHEDPLLRFYESQLCGPARANSRPDRIKLRLCSRSIPPGGRTASSKDLPKLRRPAQTALAAATSQDSAPLGITEKSLEPRLIDLKVVPAHISSKGRC